MSATRGRAASRWRTLALLAVTGILCIGLAECAVRRVAPQPRGFSWLSEDGLQLHIPGRRSTYRRDEFEAPVRFNAQGFRGAEIEPPDSRRFRIAALGDSFVEGMQVPEEELLTTRLAAALAPAYQSRVEGSGVEVLNLGVSGYGTDDALDVLRVFGPRLQPSLVLLFFCVANDFQNNALDGRCRLDEAGRVVCADLVRPSASQLRFAHAKSWLSTSSALYQALQASLTSPLWQRLGLRAAASAAPEGSLLQDLFATPTPASVEPAIAITRGLLAALDDEADRLGAPLVLVVLPIREQVEDPLWEAFAASIPSARRDGPQQILAGLARELGIEVIDPLAAFRARDAEGVRLFWRVDAHFNAEGHAVTAREVANALRADGPP